MKADRLEPAFVESIPDTLEPGRLYVSIEFRTTMHLCCCGCGNAVVLPLRRAAWRFTYDGEAITIAPSVGNWSFACRSHYIIKEGRVAWAAAWSADQVEAGRRATLEERMRGTGPDDEPPEHERAQQFGWLRRVLRRRPARPQPGSSDPS